MAAAAGAAAASVAGSGVAIAESEAPPHAPSASAIASTEDLIRNFCMMAFLFACQHKRVLDTAARPRARQLAVIRTELRQHTLDDDRLAFARLRFDMHGPVVGTQRSIREVD